MWSGNPTTEYTVVVYSKHMGKSIVNSKGKSIMYNMDGSSPSGFKNSTYCGMNCTGNGTTPNPPPSPDPSYPTPGPSPLPPNTIVDYSTVKINSL
jgi:hypothetical protein